MARRVHFSFLYNRVNLWTPAGLGRAVQHTSLIAGKEFQEKDCRKYYTLEQWLIIGTPHHNVYLRA